MITCVATEHRCTAREKWSAFLEVAWYYVTSTHTQIVMLSSSQPGTRLETPYKTCPLDHITSVRKINTYMNRLYLAERLLPFSRERRLVPCWRCALNPGSAHRHRPLICHSLPIKGQSLKCPARRAAMKESPPPPSSAWSPFTCGWIYRGGTRLPHHHKITFWHMSCEQGTAMASARCVDYVDGLKRGRNRACVCSWICRLRRSARPVKAESVR